MVEARATAKYVRMSPRKARQVMDLIRGHSVVRARQILRLSTRRAAVPIDKTLRSAVANAIVAEGSGRMTEADLTIKKAVVDEGATLKRYQPRAMGRASLIRRRTSHITVIVEGERGEEKVQAKAGRKRSSRKPGGK